jgi:hypothetical protein
MIRALLYLPVALAAAATVLPSDPPGESYRPPDPASIAGKWRVEFSNGVKQVCDFIDNGVCSVEQPHRRSIGKAEKQGGSTVITFADDRVERWTRVGDRFVVEHWYPGSRLPTVSPVLGIAETSARTKSKKKKE